MKERHRRARGADLAPIEAPADDAAGGPKWNKMRERLRRRLMRSRLFEPGRRYACPDCGGRTLAATDDLVQEVRRGDQLVVLENLEGARCFECGFSLLEGREEMRIDDAYERLIGPTHEAAITRIGRGTLGTYWPKAVERGLDMAPGDRLRVRLLSRGSALLDVQKGRRRKTRRQGSKRRPA